MPPVNRKRYCAVNMSRPALASPFLSPPVSLAYTRNQFLSDTALDSDDVVPLITLERIEHGENQEIARWSLDCFHVGGRNKRPNCL